MVVGAGGVFEQRDAVESRVESIGAEKVATELLRRRIGDPERGRVLGSEDDGRGQVNVSSARQFHSPHIQIVDLDGEVGGELAFAPEAGLFAVRSQKVRVGAEDRGCDSGQRSFQGSASCLLEDARRRRAVRHLLESLDAIFDQGAIQVRQHVPVVEQPVAGAQHPPVCRTVGQPHARADIVGILLETSGQVLKVIAEPEVGGQPVADRPMVGGKRAVAGNAKTRGRVPERLTEEVRAASQKVIQSRKDVKSAEAIRGIGVKVDVVDHPSAFEQMMPSAEGQRVTDLVVVLATPAVSVVGTSKLHQATNFDPRA